MFGIPGWVEVLIIATIVLLLFGKRLPSTMRSLGQGLVEFKRGLKEPFDAETDSQSH